MNRKTFAGLCGISLPKLQSAADSVAAGEGYQQVLVPKRRGGWRVTLRPSPSVDVALTALRDGLSRFYMAPDHVHGYVRRRDTTTNARPHCGQRVVLGIDLEDFFGSITVRRIEDSLRQLGFDEALISIITTAGCVDDSLPAGFPSSPVLSNLAFLETDAALAAYATAKGLAFTRYADDMTFSSSRLDDTELAEIGSVLRDQGWRLNDKKTRFMRSGKAQYVTGLYVGLGDGPRVPRRLKRALRMQLHFLEKYGYEDCHANTAWTPGHRRVWGLINYIKRLEPTLAARLAETAGLIDFQLPERFGVDDDWDEMLDELGVPDWL
jgi:RNA-directed DNA polymerase